jgi:glycosyltransferase involved in cell wall biosynthesis
MSLGSMEFQESVCAVILTFNEQRHIERCISSVGRIANSIYVIDSYSTDDTVAIARRLGAHVLQHTFRNHSEQLAWAIGAIQSDATWLIRVDADEILDDLLVRDLARNIRSAPKTITGFLLPRYVKFLGRIVSHGGFPQWQLRVWRAGCAVIESRWMDEHFTLTSGEAPKVRGMLLDDNQNSLSWWIDKHNGYATREAIELLNLRYKFIDRGPAAGALTRDARLKRWVKETIYQRMPLGLRAFAYFIYRITLRLGVLDGPKGMVFHFFQGLWYRLLVDAKVDEIERCMRLESISCVEAVERQFGVRLN